MTKPIKIATVPAVETIDREALAAQIPDARDAAERCLQRVVKDGVLRDIGLTVSARLNERADVLTLALESGASDQDIARLLNGFAALIVDAQLIAADPVAIQTKHDLLAVGPRAESAPVVQ